MIIPLIPPSFVLPHLCPDPFSLGSGQGRAAPAGEAALCWGGRASSLLGLEGKAGEMELWCLFGGQVLGRAAQTLLWCPPCFCYQQSPPGVAAGKQEPSQLG